MAKECKSCSRCERPLSDFEKMIAEKLGADKVYCKGCVKKIENEWSELQIRYLEDRLIPEEIECFEELDELLKKLEAAGYYENNPANICPQCGRETLERMGEGSFMRTRCISCGYDNLDKSKSP